MALLFEPGHDAVDGVVVRGVAEGQHALVGNDRHPAGAREAQQFREDAAHVVDDVGALGQVAQHFHHHAPHLEAEGQFARVLARLDAQRQHLAQLLAGGALLEFHRRRAFVVAGNQAPELALDDERDRHRGQRAHVAHVLQVHRRHAAQGCERQIVGGAGDRIARRYQRRRRVVGVLDQADALQRVQFARLGRDVRGREALAHIGHVIVLLRLGHHVAVAVGVELVDHHAAVAGHGAYVVGRQRGQRFERCGFVDVQQEVAEQRIQFAETGRRIALDGFEFDDDHAVPGMGQDVEVLAVAGGDGAEVEGAVGQLVVLQRRRQAGSGGFADHVGQRGADHGFGFDAGPAVEVGAGLQHGQLWRQGQQEAVRLDAAGCANRFLVAAGQVERYGLA